MEAPRLPSFFKSKRARQFEYRPFYYDKEKEERRLRRKEFAKTEDDNRAPKDAEKSEKLFHSNIRGQWGKTNSVHRIKTSSNQRLIFIIVALLALCWWFYRDLLL